MKKILVGLLAFTFGVAAVYFLKNKKFETVNSIEPAKTTLFRKPISDLRETIKKSQNENENKTETFKPFFDSFEENEGFNGWFIADKFKGMKEVWAILLDRDSENSQTEELKWSAMILTVNKDDSANDDDDFHSIQIKTNGRNLSFTTNKIRGIEYKFAGEFNNSFYKFEEGKKVLKGKLQKFVKGKKIAEFTADFKFYEPHCLH
jgi:hypothetical protein